MSITATFIRLFPDEWNSLLELSQDEFNNFELSLIVSNSEKEMDLDGDWQALHFLLTGKITDVSDDEVRPATSDPLESVVMGGHKVFVWIRLRSVFVTRNGESMQFRIESSHGSPLLKQACSGHFQCLIYLSLLYTGSLA